MPFDFRPVVSTYQLSARVPPSLANSQKADTQASNSFTAGAILIASSFSYAQLVVGRLVLGVGVGGAAIICPLYITELAPTAARGRCVGTK